MCSIAVVIDGQSSSRGPFSDKYYFFGHAVVSDYLPFSILSHNHCYGCNEKKVVDWCLNRYR